MIEVGESSVVAPTSINNETTDDEDEPRQPKIQSLRDLYDSTNEVHLVCLLADAENISFEETVRDKKWQTSMDEEIKAIGRNNTTFSWFSKKQPIVMLSTCEVEYVATS